MTGEAPLLAAVAHLRAQRHAEALALLTGVLDAAALPTALRARALGLRAQALDGLGRRQEACADVDDAIRLARELGDTQGVQQLRGLSGQIRAVLALEATRRAQSEATAATPLKALLAGELSPLEQALALIQKADAELDAGRVAAGAFLAQRALDLAAAQPDSTREQVYAWLALARARPERASEYLHDARDLADRTNNQAMITAVAHAARAAGVSFTPYSF